VKKERKIYIKTKKERRRFPKNGQMGPEAEAHIDLLKERGHVTAGKKTATGRHMEETAPENEVSPATHVWPTLAIGRR